MGVHYFNFDTPYTFAKSEYYFTYKGTTFKLIGGDDTYQHLLITLCKEDKYPIEAANNALEFLACLAWDSHTRLESSLGEITSGDYTLEQLSEKSYAKRYTPVGEVKHAFPLKIVNIKSKHASNVISLYKEILLTRRSLPQYAFLSACKLVELIDGTHNQSKQLYQFIGWSFFRKKKFKSKKEIYQYLKDKVRNAIAHGRNKKRMISMIDAEMFYELSELNRAMDSNLRKYIMKYFEKEPPLYLFDVVGQKYPEFMTEKEYLNKYP